MPTAIVTVKYVNPPKEGKKRASIKTTDDVLFGVWANQIGQYEVGKSYEIDYSDDNGFFTIKSSRPIVLAERPSPSVVPIKSASPAPTANGNSRYGTTDDRTAERIFVCGALNAAIQGGRIELTGTRVEDTVRMLREVWSVTFGETLSPQNQNGHRQTASAH